MVKVKSIGNPAGIGQGTGLGLRERERDGIGLGLSRLRTTFSICIVKVFFDHVILDCCLNPLLSLYSTIG